MDLMDVSNFFISFSAADSSFFSFVFFSDFFELILIPKDEKINNARLNDVEKNNHAIIFSNLLSNSSNGGKPGLQMFNGIIYHPMKNVLIVPLF